MSMRRLPRRDLLSLTVKGAAGLTLSPFLVGCGSSPSSPTAPPATGGGTPPRNVSFAARAVETLSGRSLGVDFVVDGSGQQYSGRTDRDPIQVPTGRYTIKVGMNTGNQRTSDTLVPSIYENVVIDGDGELATDLLPMTAFGGYNPRNIIEVYRGRTTSTVLWGKNIRWSQPPTKFKIFDSDGSFTGQPNPKNSSNFDRYLQAMAYVQEFTNGMISVPNPDQVEIFSGLPPGATNQQPYTNYEPGSHNFVNTTVAYELDGTNNNRDLYYSAPWVAIRPSAFDTLVAEFLASTQLGDNETDRFVYVCAFDNLNARKPLDSIWPAKINYGARKPGEVILPESDAYQFPHEFRLL